MSTRPSREESTSAPGLVERRATRRRLIAGIAAATLLAAGCGLRDTLEARLREAVAARQAARSASAGPPPAEPAQPAPQPTPQPVRDAPGLPGRLLFVSDANIWVYEGKTARQLTDDRVSRQPSWSFDGSRIALVKLAPNASNIWIMQADASNPRQLTQNDKRDLQHSNWNFRPGFSPDGTRLVYLAEDTTYDLMIWQMNVNGTGRRLWFSMPDFQGGMDSPSYSPEGSRLLFMAFVNGVGQLFIGNTQTGQRRQITTGQEHKYDPAWSPDGSLIAFAMRERGKTDIYIMNADGTGRVRVTQAGVCRAPAWSPDGRYLAYLSAQTGSFELWVTELDGLEEGRFQHRQVTRNAAIDATSGLSWGR